MKKLLLSILLLGGLSASAQVQLTSNNMIPNKDGGFSYYDVKPNNVELIKILKSDGSILERVSYRNEKYGTSIDQSKEVQFRKAKIAEYKKLGYAFDGMVTGANGKFMKFVK